MKLDKIFIQQTQREKIEKKFNERKEYLEKNIKAKKEAGRQKHKNFVAQKNRELEALNLDPEDYKRYVLDIDPEATSDANSTHERHEKSRAKSEVSV